LEVAEAAAANSKVSLNTAGYINQFKQLDRFAIACVGQFAKLVITHILTRS
jgi:hypothetical protein